MRSRIACCCILLASLLIMSGCLVPNEAPTAVIDASRQSGRAPVRVSFDAYDSWDPDGSVNRCEWSFGDGASDTGKFVSHTYNSPGSYTVTLTIWDDEGASDTATTTITILEGPVVGDFRMSSAGWEPSICWLIVSWPCLYVYGTVASSSPYPARVEVEFTAYNSQGAIAGRTTTWSYSCDVAPGASFVVDTKIPDIEGPIESVTRVDGRVVGVEACN